MCLLRQRERRRRKFRQRALTRLRQQSGDPELTALSAADEAAIEARVAILESCSYPCTVSEWTERQGVVCDELALDLEEDWRTKLTAELGEALEDRFNLYQREVEPYEQSPLRALLVRVAHVEPCWHAGLGCCRRH